MNATTALRGHDTTERNTGTRSKKARFEMKMPAELKTQLERAAEVVGVSATDNHATRVLRYASC